MLSGVLAGQSFTTSITGDDSLRRRPMRRVIEPLRQMGAEIESQEGGRAPLEIRGRKLHAIDYSTPIPSAQVKSAILLAGLYAEGSTIVRESVATRDHTERALIGFGATVENVNGSKGAVRIQPEPKLTGRQLVVPGDLSAAVFLIGATMVLPESSITLHNVGLNPTRAKVLDFLISIGAPIQVGSLQMRDGELVGDLAVRHAPLAGGTVSGSQVAEMIDELPMLAALGPFTEKGIEIHDAQELRVKESDRIAAIAESLRLWARPSRNFQTACASKAAPRGKLRGAKVDPKGDHRIAMALSVAALGAEGDTTIRDADCVGVSFPEFFATLDRLRGAIASGTQDVARLRHFPQVNVPYVVAIEIFGPPVPTLPLIGPPRRPTPHSRRRREFALRFALCGARGNFKIRIGRQLHLNLAGPVLRYSLLRAAASNIAPSMSPCVSATSSRPAMFSTLISLCRVKILADPVVPDTSICPESSIIFPVRCSSVTCDSCAAHCNVFPILLARIGP